MRKFVVIGIVILFILIGGSAWFWSMGSVPNETTKLMTLRVENPGVAVRAPNATNWEAAEDGMEIGTGWSVKTDGAGFATISAYGRGETRLDHETEVTVSSAADSGTAANVEVVLSVGRAWTRMLRFFDLDGAYSVKTSAVVATVRGTAFSVKAKPGGETEIVVTDSGVELVPAGQVSFDTPVTLAAGHAVVIAANGRVGDPRELSDADRSDDWIRRNETSDGAFLDRELAAQNAELGKLGGVSPANSFYGLGALSERMHLALTKTEVRERLATTYMTRRLMLILDLARNGKAGFAAQEFARLENEIRRSSGVQGAADRRHLRAAIARIALIVEGSKSDSPLYAFRSKLESLMSAASDPDQPSAIYARLIAVEDQIEDAERAISAGKLEEARTALDGAKSGIENIVRESATVITGFDAGARHVIRGKIAVLKARTEAAQKRLDAALSGGSATSTSSGLPPESATSTGSGTGSGTPAPSGTGGENGGTTSTSTAPVDADIASIRVSVQPTSIEVGKTASIHVVAVRTDGSTTDVSAHATFQNQNEGVAHLNGLELDAVNAGTSRITATYVTASGITLTASASYTVTAPRGIPTGLVITSSKGTTLAPGDAAKLSAVAVYENGSERPVTSQTAFVLQPGSAGLISGSSFIAGAAGTTVIAATYSENGTTVRTTLTLQVTSQ